jgi:hypothetical protein
MQTLAPVAGVHPPVGYAVVSLIGVPAAIWYLMFC